MFQNKVVVITGGANGIGKTIAEEFRKEGAEVCIIDIAENDYFVGDISKKEVLDTQSAEMKDLQKLPDAWDTYKRLKSVADNLRSIKFTKAKEKYKAEHKAELNQFYAANRLLTKYCPDGKYNNKAIQTRYAELEQQHDADYAAFKDLQEETQMLWRIKSHIDAALKTREKENTHTHEITI